ncbi:pilus assembly protein [Vibrio lamellibrachiae]|uniref:TadE/TadG family type IV pilus assembly protein n=1 Tax=Vibrio lamellibrachiae TaxID=2910253 RepID=UPI003D0A4FB1
MRKQNGITIVEFTLVSTALLILVLGIIEVGRYMYSLQLINEMTRVAARLGVVCHIDDQDDIPALVVPSNAPGGFTAANLTIEYIDGSGVVVGNPDADFLDIEYVRARVIDFDYEFAGLLSFLQGNIPVPTFETTLPRENLGEIRGSVNDTDC